MISLYSSPVPTLQGALDHAKLALDVLDRILYYPICLVISHGNLLQHYLHITLSLSLSLLTASFSAKIAGSLSLLRITFR